LETRKFAAQYPPDGRLDSVSKKRPIPVSGVVLFVFVASALKIAFSGQKWCSIWG
jgi:hypothetical protein